MPASFSHAILCGHVDARKLDNPYLAPATVHVPSALSTVPYAKIAGFAFPVSAAYGLLVGAFGAAGGGFLSGGTEPSVTGGKGGSELTRGVRGFGPLP